MTIPKTIRFYENHFRLMQSERWNGFKCRSVLTLLFDTIESKPISTSTEVHI